LDKPDQAASKTSSKNLADQVYGDLLPRSTTFSGSKRSEPDSLHFDESIYPPGENKPIAFLHRSDGAGDKNTVPFSEFKYGGGIEPPDRSGTSPVNAEASALEIRNDQKDAHDHALRAMDYLIKRGLSPQEAAGVVGNYMMDSNVSPTAIYRPTSGELKAGIGGFPLTQLQDYAKSRGMDPMKMQTQLDFGWQTMETAQSRDPYNPTYGRSIGEYLKTAEVTYPDATSMYRTTLEPLTSDTTQEVKREMYAHQILEYYNNR